MDAMEFKAVNQFTIKSLQEILGMKLIMLAKVMAVQANFILSLLILSLSLVQKLGPGLSPMVQCLTVSMNSLSVKMEKHANLSNNQSKMGMSGAC